MADTKISLLTEKTTPVDADQTNIIDSEASNADKRMTLANLRKVVVATAGSENQVATFDANGKLVGTALITSTASAVTIGNADSATVQIGHASGGGLNVLGNATFNGALLSPGTGTNSFKAGPGAAAANTGGVAIGNNASSAGSGSGLAIGNNATVSGTFSPVAIGASASATGSRSVAVGESSTAANTWSTALGYRASAGHNYSVALGASNDGAVASTDAFDFVLGAVSHNYKFPGTIITDLNFRTTTGTKIGTGTDQLIGFWNATPVDQPGNLAAAGADLGEVQTLANGIRSLLIEVGLMAPDP